MAVGWKRLLGLAAYSWLVGAFVHIAWAAESDLEKEVMEGEFLVGGDVSALARLEQAGAVYRTNGTPGDALEIMRNHGASCFRLRLFVNPSGRNVVVNDLEYTARLARRIKKTTARLLLDFHYSDHWADPGQQTKPGAWNNLEFDLLVETVRSYTRNCVVRLDRAGALPDFVQIGNEITPGMLWPDGKLHGVDDKQRQWRKFARLLKAGIDGVKDASEAPGIVLHVHNGGKWESVKYFFERVEDHAVPYDVIGLSFYPWHHGTLADLRRTMEKIPRMFAKDVWIVETAYPYRPMNMDRYHSENMTYAATAEGQKKYLQELIQVVSAAPDGRGLGVLWWFPESIPVKGMRIWHGGATALFDETGDALPAMSAFGLQGD